MSSDIKLAYSGAQRKIRIDFPGVACLKSDEPPETIIERAKAKLESEKAQGSIDFYEFYENVLHDLWQQVRQEGKTSPALGKTINLTLGAGAKDIPEIEVAEPSDEKSLFNLSFNASSVMINNWRFEWVMLNIDKLLRDIDIKGKLHMAQIRGAWLRACEDEKITDLPISLVSDVNKSEKPFYLMANKNRGEVALAIYDHTILSDKSQLNLILKTASDGVKKMAKNTGDQYQFLKNDLASELRSALLGPELVGVNLPLIILVGLKEKPKASEKEKISTNARKNSKNKKKISPPDESYPGMGHLNILVSDDNLEAYIVEFNMELYRDDNSFVLDSEWINKEIDRYGIKVDNEKNIAAILAAILDKQDISGMYIAQGHLGKASTKPYIYSVYKDAQIKEDDEVKDIRDMQGKNTVKPGDLVFEVRYRVPGNPGIDVYGDPITPEPGNAMVIDIGPGIELREEGKYYATEEGQPVLEDKKVSISKLYTHKGDINLKSGNIYFNGPAIIEGNIQAGATVMVKGDLTVKGSIEAAFVRSGGSIIVKEGISTTDQGRIQAREDITADYVGNSKLIAGGDLKVKKAILNSQIIVGGSIFSNKKNGTLAGGQISCRGDISVAKLGFPKGDKTIISSGIDWRAELSLRIRKSRLDRIKKINEVDRKSLRELIRKKGAQLTAKHKKNIEHLKEKLNRERTIMDKIEESISSAEKLMNWDKEVKIFVHEVLCTNVDITIGGTQVPIPGDVAGVVVSTQRYRGSFVQPMDEEDAAS